jgi:glucosylceramidase
MNYIKLITLTASVCCVGCSSGNSAGNDLASETAQKRGDITMYITAGDRSHAFSKVEVNYNKTTDVLPSATITLNPAQRYQTMHGFGAAVTGSTCYNLLRMQAENRAKFLKSTFSPTEGMGYSYIRISIGCSDFSLSEYTCCDIRGIENFALTPEENNYVIPILKEILAINPDIKILGSPWTCPRWMKVNNLTDRQPYNSWTGGQLNPDFYQDYATYFVKWIQAFAAEGIAITSVTPQNEPLNKGNSASLYMGWDEQRDFVNNALVPQLKAASLNTKIYLFDHNYNYDNFGEQNDYPAKIYASGVDNDVVAGAAYHNYGGDRSELLDIHIQYPDKELIFTEASIGEWNDGQNLAARLMDNVQNIALGTVNNWCSAVIVWNLMLDANRGPNRPGGCRTCYGAVDISSDYRNVTRNSHYYMIGHLSAVVKPSAVRIGASANTPAGITYSAFENPDGSYAVVLLNNTAENREIGLNDGNNYFKYNVPAKSVVSYQWNFKRQ